MSCKRCDGTFMIRQTSFTLSRLSFTLELPINIFNYYYYLHYQLLVIINRLWMHTCSSHNRMVVSADPLAILPACTSICPTSSSWPINSRISLTSYNLRIGQWLILTHLLVPLADGLISMITNENRLINSNGTRCCTMYHFQQQATLQISTDRYTLQTSKSQTCKAPRAPA